MAEQVRGLVDREKFAWQEFTKRLDFATEAMDTGLGKDAVKDACVKLLEEAEKFSPLFRQRAVLEFPEIRKEKA